MTNLALQPAYKNKLLELRTKLTNKMISLNDIGLYPESEWIEKAGSNPYLFATNHSEKTKEYMCVANLMLSPFNKVKEQLAKALNSKDPITKYWALSVCAIFGNEAKSMKKLALPLLKDESVCVKSKAVVFLSLIKAIDTQKEMSTVVLKAKTTPQMLLVLNDAAILKDRLSITFDFTNDVDYSNLNVKKRLEYLSGKKLSQKNKGMKNKEIEEN